MSESYDTVLRDMVLDGDRFVSATLQGTRHEGAFPWQRVTIRPVLLKGVRHLQFVYFDGKQDTARNVHDDEIAALFSELLTLPFKSIQAITTDESVRIQFSKKGRPILHRERRSPEAIPLNVAHDRVKPALLGDDQRAPLLSAIGVATADGRIRADQQRKFRQINEFLRLIEETGEIETLETRPLRVVDLGCGSAALTFATYHYLNNVKHIPTTLIGVDAKAHLMERHNETAAGLGWGDLEFTPGRIAEFNPPHKPDIVLALHACDTATDEALAQAVKWQSRLIFSAPCCHHHLQAQLAGGEMPEPFRPVIRQGILRERLGDILTDAFRAHLLRLLGYRADVIEFVDQQHTPKNIMIRAVLKNTPPPATLIDEYKSLKSYWGVKPYLEVLLEDQLAAILAPLK